MRQKRSFDRHFTFKVVLTCLSVIYIPVMGILWKCIDSQAQAMTEWEEVECIVRQSSVMNAAAEKKRKLRARTEWEPLVKCEYTWPADGKVRITENVWYYGSSTGSSWKTADEAVSKFPHGSKKTAFVNPLNPDESFLIGEVWFRPYGLTLLALLLAQCIVWLVMIEYNWHARRYDPHHLPAISDSSTDTTWHEIQIPLKHRPLSFYRKPLLFLIYWHVMGGWILYSYKSKPHFPFGWKEEICTYHAIGIALCFRLAYLYTFSYFVGDLQLWVSSGKFTTDENYILRMKQEVRKPGGVVYQSVIASIVLAETAQLEKGNKTAGGKKLVYQKDYALAADACVKQHDHLELNLRGLMFPETPTNTTHTRPSTRQWTNWYLSIDISIESCPFAYSLSLPLVVYDR